MNKVDQLVDKVARLNPTAGEIGPGMLATIVALAREIQQDKRDFERADEDRRDSIRDEELSNYRRKDD